MSGQNTLLAGLFKHLMTIKMFHFQTDSGFRHLKMDEYLSEYLIQFDLFFELWQAGSAKLDTKGFKIDVKTYTDEQFPTYLENFCTWLKALDDTKWPDGTAGVRDDIIKSATKMIYVTRDFK